VTDSPISPNGGRDSSGYDAGGVGAGGVAVGAGGVQVARRPLQIGRGWVQAAALVSLTGLFVVVLMGFLSYQSAPPVPARVQTASGATVFTGADVRAGQDVFLRNGLME
jgi:nitric oxide reductase subunit B